MSGRIGADFFLYALRTRIYIVAKWNKGGIVLDVVVALMGGMFR